ncbi:MAG: hypothetical protein OXF25_04015 [Cyanobacteria bacterium MAG CAR3_bin_5]|nr:hypothetical protein [Cyanobacteria bacterium MAG CAR3_bin_5]
MILLGVGLYVNLLSKRIDELREGMKAMDAGQREGNKALNEKGLMYVSTQEFKNRSRTSFSARACVVGLQEVIGWTTRASCSTVIGYLCT